MTARAERSHDGRRPRKNTIHPCVRQVQNHDRPLNLQKATALRAVPQRAVCFAGKRIQAWARIMSSLAGHYNKIKFPPQTVTNAWS